MGAEIVGSQRDLQDNDVLVRAYQCDANLNEVPSTNPLGKGTKIRICIATHLRSKLRGIFLSKVANFHFLKEDDGDRPDTEEVLIENGIETSDKTRLTCRPGSDLCFFESIPNDDFFVLGGMVLAIGNVMLQYDEYENLLFDTTSLRGSNRKLMDTRKLVDTMTTVEMSFAVGDGLDGPSRLARDFREHWESIPGYRKALYIFGLVLLFVILVGVCAGMCVWADCCTKTREEKDMGEDPTVVTKTPASVTKDEGTFVGDEEDDSGFLAAAPLKTPEMDESKVEAPKQVYVRSHNDANSANKASLLKTNYSDAGTSRMKMRQVPTGTLGPFGSPRKQSMDCRQQRKPRQSPGPSPKPEVPAGSPARTKRDENFENKKGGTRKRTEAPVRKAAPFIFTSPSRSRGKQNVDRPKSASTPASVGTKPVSGHFGSPRRTRDQKSIHTRMQASRAPNKGRNNSNRVVGDVSPRKKHMADNKRAKKAASLRWLDQKKAKMNPNTTSVLGPVPPKKEVVLSPAERRKEPNIGQTNRATSSTRTVRFARESAPSMKKPPSERLRTNPRIVD